MKTQEQAARKGRRPTGRGGSGLELTNSITLDRANISLARSFDSVNKANVAILNA
jgi:hypothetical protein